MSNQYAKPAEIIHLPLGADLGRTETVTLVKTSQMELIRLVIPAGRELQSHKAPAEITMQCLEGRVTVATAAKTQELTAGQLVYLAAGEPHAVKGIEDSSVLLTVLSPSGKSTPSKPVGRLDVVQEAGEESFPASDPPAF